MTELEARMEAAARSYEARCAGTRDPRLLKQIYQDAYDSAVTKRIRIPRYVPQN